MYIKVIHTLHFLAQSPELICGSFKDALHQKEQQPLARSEGRTIVGGGDSGKCGAGRESRARLLLRSRGVFADQEEV